MRRSYELSCTFDELEAKLKLIDDLEKRVKFLESRIGMPQQKCTCGDVAHQGCPVHEIV
jgi:hypothetical protein